MPPKKDDCVICSKTVGAKDGIQCEICDKWQHAKCAGIAIEMYQYISDNQQIHWFCQGCNAGVGQLIKDLKKVQDKISNIEREVDKIREEEHRDIEIVRKDMEKVSKELKEMHKEIESVKLNITTRVDTQVDNTVKQQEKKWAEALTKQMDDELKTRSSDLKTMQKVISEAKENASEIQDKENRRNNIILYRVEESKADTAEERNFEDVKFSLGLFVAIRSGIDKEDITKVTRLGRRGEKGDASRPLLVQLNGCLPKNLIMENLSKLKNAEKIQEGHRITRHDKKERESCRAMVEEAKIKTTQDSSEEWVNENIEGEEDLLEETRDCNV
jgi:hypothetical protein